MAKLIRIDESAHLMAKMAAVREGVSLEVWVSSAIKSAVTKPKTEKKPPVNGSRAAK